MSKKMAAVVTLNPRAKEQYTSYLGMVIMLGSWSLLFGGLFFAYAGVRMSAPVWPPPGVPKLPLALPFANTVVLALSSVTVQKGLASIRAAKPQRLQAFVGATLVLGALFLGLQFVLWQSAKASGLTIDSGGTYGSVFYALTLVHAAHVVVGVGGLAFVLVQTQRNKYSAPAHVPVRLWAMFWHFIDAVWVATFLAVFVL